MQVIYDLVPRAQLLAARCDVIDFALLFAQCRLSSQYLKDKPLISSRELKVVKELTSSRFHPYLKGSLNAGSSTSVTRRIPCCCWRRGVVSSDDESVHIFLMF